MAYSDQQIADKLRELFDEADELTAAREWDNLVPLLEHTSLEAVRLTGTRVQIRASRTGGAQKDPRYSDSVFQAFDILGAFDEQDRIMLGIAEIADLVGMSRSTVHRYAISLCAIGQLMQTPTRKYRRPPVFEAVQAIVPKPTRRRLALAS
jgi:AraC-like DNA-binding protein